MKANEAPEKIYIQSFNVREEDVKFDKSKMFFDDVWTEEPELEQENIEYTRTDAFIKKACSGIEKLLSGYIIRNFHFGDSYNIDRLIDDFKNYMKGEI